jgi:hypothetical protein
MDGTAQRTEESWRTRLVGVHDLQGRESLQVTLKGDWCYVGHLPGRALNPLTGEVEENGTSILDVSDPAAPVLVCHIPAEADANCRAVQVIHSPGDGRAYLTRNNEAPGAAGLDVFDVTDRSRPVRTAAIRETPAGSISSSHKGWWDEATGLYFASVGEPGFRPGGHLGIWDLSDPRRPAFVGRHWIPGQHESEPDPDPGGRGLTMHHPIVDMAAGRAYMGYPWGGQLVVVDLADIANPRSILTYSIEPTFNKGPHTAIPFFGVECPNFSPGIGDVRDFILFVNEANNWRPSKKEVRTMLFVLDVTAWDHPMTVETFRVPDAAYIDRGGRFGPHQFAETRDGRLYAPAENDNLLFVAYFSGGLRILDVADPFDVREVGFYVPAITERTMARPSRFDDAPELQGLVKRVIQTNDVDLDQRGLAYLTDRAGTGLHIIEFMGREPTTAGSTPGSAAPRPG